MTDWDKLTPPSKIIFTGIDLGTEEKSIEYAVKYGKIIWIEEVAPISEKAYNNLKPAHDPYTNPNAAIYYECKCGAILDPGTKSFASLNNHASLVGWKIRFSSDGYIPYCVKCGEGVE